MLFIGVRSPVASFIEPNTKPPSVSPRSGSPDGAPAAPDGLELDFKNGELSGTVTFTIPDKNFGGETLEGEVEYLLRANGSLFTRGTASPGETVCANGKVDADGEHKFVLELSNAAGRGPKTNASQWIGHDTPVKLTSASLTYADGRFTIAWEHPASTEHGGYMDPSLLSYDVTRLNDNFVVARAAGGFRWIPGIRPHILFLSQN